MSAPTLGIDFGTSHTVAVVRRADGRTESLLFDSSPLLPSAVFIDDGDVLVGRDALHSARVAPARLEPHPKRRIDDGTVLLGDDEWSVADLFAAVLKRVRHECVQVLGQVPPNVVVTHPAVWGPTRRSVLLDACTRAGLGDIQLVPEPVAAATYFVEKLDHQVAVGASIVVYDFGGGTFDATVVTRTASGFTVTALDGLDHLGGIDIDAAVTAHLRSRIEDSRDWGWLDSPETAAHRRGRHGFVEDVRLAKERLARHASADLYIPVLDRDVHLTRSELDELAAPLVARSVRVVQAVIQEAGVAPEQLAGVFLVGGASRMPLVATMLHRELGVAPIVVDQLEQVVAQGALQAGGSVTDSAPGPSAAVPPGPSAAVPPGPSAAVPPAAVAPTVAPPTAASPALAASVGDAAPDPESEAHEERVKPTVSEVESPPSRSRFGRRAMLAGGIGALAIAAIPTALAFSGEDEPDDGENQSTPQWEPEVFAEGLTDVGAVAFSPDGEIVAIAVEGGVELWNGSELVTRLSHEGTSDRLVFSADGRRVANRGVVQSCVWTVDSGERDCLLENEPQAVALDPDGGRVAYDDGNEVKLWDIDSQSFVYTWQLRAAVHSLGFSPDAGYLAVGWEGAPVAEHKVGRQVKIFATNDYSEATVLDYSAARVGPVMFSPDGSVLAVTGSVRVDLWNIEGWESVEGVPSRSNACDSIAFSPDGTMLAVSGHVSIERDVEQVYLWDLTTGGLIAELSGGRGPVRGVAFGPDGKTIAGAFEDSVVMWRRS